MLLVGRTAIPESTGMVVQGKRAHLLHGAGDSHQKGRLPLFHSPCAYSMSHAMCPGRCALLRERPLRPSCRPFRSIHCSRATARCTDTSQPIKVMACVACLCRIRDKLAPVSTPLCEEQSCHTRQCLTSCACSHIALCCRRLSLKLRVRSSQLKRQILVHSDADSSAPQHCPDKHGLGCRWTWALEQRAR